MLAAVSKPLPDPVVEELRALRSSVESMAQRLEQLAATNDALHARLERSEAARADLLAQTGRLIELLGEARAELRQRGSTAR